MPCQIDLISLHKWANDRFIVDIAVSVLSLFLLFHNIFLNMYNTFLYLYFNKSYEKKAKNNVFSKIHTFTVKAMQSIIGLSMIKLYSYNGMFYKLNDLKALF